MKDILSYLRSIFVSVEVLLVCVYVILWIYIPSLFIWIDKKLINVSVGYYVTTFGAIFMMALGLAWKILFPARNSKYLNQWPGYPYLRFTTIMGINFVVIGFISVLIGAFGHGEFQNGLSVLLIMCGYTIAGVSVLSMLYAAFVLRSIMSHGN